MSPVYLTTTLAEPLPGLAARANSITLTGAEPGAQVAICFSHHGGGSPIPGCDAQENSMQIDEPRVIAVRHADGTGRVTFSSFVSGTLRGKPLLLQAVNRNACAISNYVLTTFE